MCMMSEAFFFNTEAATAGADATETDAGSATSRGGRKRTASRMDRQRGPGRRRTEYRRAAEDGCMNDEQMDFLRAVEEYKRVNNRPFPSCTEYLDILLYLGYRRVAPVGEFALVKSRRDAGSE
jgi:hypothetical protein